MVKRIYECIGNNGGHILTCFVNIHLRSVFSEIGYVVVCLSTVLNGSPHITRTKRCLSQEWGGYLSCSMFSISFI
jgi:hypothetical protein